METTPGHPSRLAVRWTAGVAVIVATRLLLENLLPGGVAMGLGLALFSFFWIPAVPAESYERGSTLRPVLYTRLALFVVAALVGAVLYEILEQAIR